MVNDLSRALRSLARAPGFTAVAVLTLALGIGAVTAIYGVVRGVLLRPLPFDQPDELLTLCETNPEVAGFCIASPPTVADWAEQSETLEAIGLGRSEPMLWQRPEGSTGVSGGWATPGLFAALGVSPELGRLLAVEDLVPGAPRVVVLSHELWRDELGADPAVVGSLLDLDGVAHRVVGVLPDGLEVPRLEWPRLWVPLPFSSRDEENRGWRGFVVLARMAEGREPEDVATELAVIQDRLGREYPETHEGWGVAVERLHDHLVGGVRTTLLLFLAAVGLVLLVAAANVAHLVLARATVRRRELAVRTALGASRTQLARLALAEGAVLALAACALGVLLAVIGTRVFLDLAPAGIPRLDQVRLDGGVLGFALLLAVLSTLLFGILPAASLAETRLGALLHEVSTGEAPSRGRFRGGLVVAEVAIAVTLLAASGLLIRSFINLLTWDPGFERGGLVTVSLFSSPAKYPTPEDVLRAHEAAAEAVAALPGVESVGMASAGPLFGGRETGRAMPARVGTAGPPEPGEGVPVRWYDVGPGYFRTLGVPVVRGRGITAADRRGQPRVALVNETAARRLWPGVDPVGKSVWVDYPDAPLEVVGVVRDVPPLESGRPVEPEVYWPYAQLPRWGVFLVIRATGDPAAVVRPAQARLAELDPDLQAGRWSTLDELVGSELRQPRFTLLLVALFAAIAAILAAVGIYGLLSYVVARRTREIGVRMALGAERRRIETAVVAQALRLAVAGVVLGLAGAVAVSRLLQGLLHGVAPTDPWTYAAVAVLALAVTVVASWLPARRAGSLDPLEALRTE
jgi:putative ABC transport system permease protein